MGFNFLLRRIFFKDNIVKKHENYPHTKISIFSLSHYLISVAEGLALPDLYDNFDVFNNKSVRLLHTEAIKLEAIVHYCC